MTLSRRATAEVLGTAFLFSDPAFPLVGTLASFRGKGGNTPPPRSLG